MNGGVERQHLEGAAELILKRGLIGLAWLDDTLVVRRRRGRAADWIEVGAPLAEALPMLVGYEDRFAAMRAVPSESIVLPNVGFNDAGRTGGKFDLQVYRLPEIAEFLVVVCQESTQSLLALELHRETARRQIAESREAELARSLKRTNEELSRANRDLEEFAYVISHDLRAPLRALRQTTEMLEHEIADHIAPPARERLVSIRLLARRMTSMMSGLLQYARVGRKAEAIEEIDTAALVRDVVRGIGRPEGMRIRLAGDWPRLRTLVEPLDVVLRNLVENAVKHHDRAEGEIVVSAQDDGASVRIEIADDGPGIDPAYHGAIFQPFRSAAETMPAESSGIGLALVKKTVDTVGGQIEVRSRSGERGTTFRLLWPKVVETG